MNECEFIDKCPLYNNEMKGDAVKIDKIKENYCRTNCMHCARYMVATAINPETVPEDLYPDQKGKAYEIIGGN